MGGAPQRESRGHFTGHELAVWTDARHVVPSHAASAAERVKPDRGLQCPSTVRDKSNITKRSTRIMRIIITMHNRWPIGSASIMTRSLRDWILTAAGLQISPPAAVIIRLLFSNAFQRPW